LQIAARASRPPRHKAPQDIDRVFDLVEDACCPKEKADKADGGDRSGARSIVDRAEQPFEEAAQFRADDEL
jgi:hypothetical protein